MPYFAQLPANAEKPGVGGGLRSPAQRRERAVEVVARCGGGRRGWPPPDLPTCSRHPGFTARATASRDDPKRASVFYETASPARVSPDSLVEESGFEPAVPLCERIGLSGKNADASQTTRMGLERVGHVAGPRVANVEDSGSYRPRRLLKPRRPRAMALISVGSHFALWYGSARPGSTSLDATPRRRKATAALSSNKASVALGPN